MKTTLKQVDNGNIELSVLAETYKEKQMLQNANDTFKDIIAKNPKAECELIIKRIVKKRTLDQNAFMWSLLTEYSKHINGERTTQAEVDELYCEQLKKHTLPIRLLLLNEALETYTKHTKPRFWLIKGYTKAQNKQYVYVDVWQGSSHYDTKEMAKLINGILDDMQAKGINTQEFIKMTREWKEFERSMNEKAKKPTNK